MINFNSAFPLIKENNDHKNYLTPKISLKFNPHDMKNYSTSDRKIGTENIFNNDRLGLEDTLETGKSLTFGVDYKREKIDDINKFFEMKLATVIRDKEENFIPSKSTINKKNSNLFGSISNNFSEHLSIDYEFALDNNFEIFEYNNFSTNIRFDKFETIFNFIEENGAMGDSNVFENTSKFTIDENNYVSFKTRRNRRIDLTEYYDLVYEYKNDCLTAGIKYKKTYYEDRDLKPSENVFFTITLYPLTTFEQKIDQQ
jgi:Organic solvent tolerance protein OstA